jgi:hypothetical protein
MNTGAAALNIIFLALTPGMKGGRRGEGHFALEADCSGDMDLPLSICDGDVVLISGFGWCVFAGSRV